MDESIAAFHPYAAAAKYIHQRTVMRPELCVIGLIVKIQGNIDRLLIQLLSKKHLPVADDDGTIASGTERRICSVDTSELDDMLIECGIFLCIACAERQAGTEVVIRMILLTSLNAEFRTVINGWDAGHTVQEGISREQIRRVLHRACKAIDIVVVHKVIKPDIPVNAAVRTGLAVDGIVDLKEILIIMGGRNRASPDLPNGYNRRG